MRSLTYKILPEDEGRKLKDILKRNLGISARVLAKLKNSCDGIMCNGVQVYTNHTVSEGEIIEITLRDTQSQNVEPSEVKINVIYEDEDILVVDKPHSIPTHPSQNHHNDTLANAVMGYYKGEDFTFRVITRLDKDTSGVVVIAKNKISASIITREMTDGQITKEYYALCHGCPAETEGKIDAPIARKKDSAIMREVDTDGKEALTYYEVVKSNDNLSLVKVRPVTGRTHQIRVHLSYIGNPIYGDDMYGSCVKGERTRLHCRKIALIHPITKKELYFESPVPDDMEF